MIGAVIVNYNTPGIISRAVNSIKEHVDNIMIVDHSDESNPAFAECNTLIDAGVAVVHTRENIGHGKGLNIGIGCLTNEYIIVMDSDAYLVDPAIIVKMIDCLTDDVYGCGLVVQVNENGGNVEKGIDYLHPYFAMFKRDVFYKYPPFINHGAPWLKTMKAIDKKVVNIPNLTDYCVHEHRRTREIAGNGWLKNWET